MTAAVARIPARLARDLRVAEGRPLHVVQVSRDGLLLEPGRSAEPLARQRAYAEELLAERPGSRMTVLVLARERGVPPPAEGGLVVTPVADRTGGLASLFQSLLRLHRERPIDVLTVQSPFEDLWIALLFARVRSVRVVGQIHFDPFAPALVAGPLALLRKARVRLALASLRWLHALRVVSHGVEREVARRGLHGRVSVIPVPIARGEPVAEPSAPPATPTVLYVGRLAPEKDLGTWLEVAARVAKEVPEAVFEVVGDGPEEGEIRARARALGLEGKLRMRGFRPSADLAAHYRAATVLLLTSRHEGFGRALLEAAAAGTPAVATRTAGSADVVVPGETGFLHPHGDVEGMAASIVCLIREPALRADFGRAAAERSQSRFPPAAFRRAWVEMLVAAAREDLGPLRTPRTRTFARWRALAFAKSTLLRALQYEAIAGVELDGRVLDLGGGRRASYLGLLHLVGAGARVESANRDRRADPTHLLDLEEPLPFPDESFDHVLSLNTFEHLEDDELALDEAFRVLRAGGSFHFAVPFLHPVHASPEDHHRHTAAWWANALAKRGADSERLAIEPLVWDRLATASSFFSGPVARVVRPLVLLPAVLLDLLVLGAERLPDRGPTRRLTEVALGWSISGIKSRAG
jgi:glycosyltransferase involved in cell wall biosynthesis